MGDDWYHQPAGRSALPDNYFQKPSPARMWNYLQGGKDNYALDRSIGDLIASCYPDMFYLARQAREFLTRTVRYVAAEAGVRQFIDLGCGLPAPHGLDNVHEVAQVIHPDARVLYVDSDKVVLAHAEALLTPLTPAGSCDYLEADVHDLELVLAKARETLDFSQPVGVVMLGILGHIPSFEEACRIVDEVMGAVPVGSFLIEHDGFDDGAGVGKGISQRNETAIESYYLRTHDQFQRFCRDLELVEPGIVPISQWRPDSAEVGATRPVAGYGAVARKAGTR